MSWQTLQLSCFLRYLIAGKTRRMWSVIIPSDQNREVYVMIPFRAQFVH